MKRPITNSSIEIKYNIDYLIVGSGLIMVCMNDSSIFCDDFYNLHLLHKVWQGYKENQQQNNMLNTKAFNITFVLYWLDFRLTETSTEGEFSLFYSLSPWTCRIVVLSETNLSFDQVWREWEPDTLLSTAGLYYNSTTNNHTSQSSKGPPGTLKGFGNWDDLKANSAMSSILVGYLVCYSWIWAPSNTKSFVLHS